MSGRLLRNTAYGSLAGWTGTICNFVSSLIVARLLGVRLTGDVTFALWVATTVSVVFSFGVPFTISRFLPDVASQDDPGRCEPLTAFVLRRFFPIASIPFVFALTIALYFGLVRHGSSSPELMERPCIILTVGLCSLVFSLAEFGRCFSRGMHRFDRLAKATIWSVLVQLVAAFFFIKTFGVLGAIIAYTLGAAALLPLLWPVIRAAPIAFGDHIHRMRRYTIFRWGSEILALFVWSRVEVLFLQSYGGASSVALFVVGLTLSSLALQGPLMLTWGLMPHFAEQIALADRNGMQQTYAMATKLLAALVLPACFGLGAISHQLIPLLFGPSFAPGSGAAGVLVVAAAFPAIATVGGTVILATDRSDVDFYTCLLCTLVSIVAGLALTKLFGLWGAVASRVLVQTLAIGIGTGYIVYRLGLRLPVAALVKLSWAATCCAFAAGLVVRASATFGPIGIAIAIACGAVTYAICLRCSDVFDPAEVAALREFAARLPRPVPWFVENLFCARGGTALNLHLTSRKYLFLNRNPS